MNSEAMSELNTQLTLWQGVRSSIWVMLRYYMKSKMWNEKQYMAFIMLKYVPSTPSFF